MTDISPSGTPSLYKFRFIPTLFGCKCKVFIINSVYLYIFHDIVHHLIFYPVLRKKSPTSKLYGRSPVKVGDEFRLASAKSTLFKLPVIVMFDQVYFL